MPLQIVHATTDADWRAGRALIDQYVASLGLDLSFQQIDDELAHLEHHYGPPAGAFLLAKDGGACVGCVGLRRFDEGVGEVKRLYADPATRGRGVGKALMTAVMAAAPGFGYRRLVLDTLPSMSDARRLYESLGFVPTAPYRFNPVPGTAFLEFTFG